MSGPEPAVWVSGALVGAAEARVSPFDRGFLVGDGVFETVRVYDGTPFALTRHLDRLTRGAAGLDLPAPDPRALREAVTQVVAANEVREGRVRITVTSGPAPPGGVPIGARDDAPATVVVAAGAVRPRAATAAVAIVPWARNERSAIAGIKSTSYVENARALAWATERGADEAVFTNTRGEVCEGAMSNVFVVRGGVVRTPPEVSGCLLGVTRALVIESCAELGVAVVETTLTPGELAEADEAFLTSTVREVQPIASVDLRPTPAAPGALTKQLADAYTALVARDPDP